MGGSWIEIDRDRLKANVALFREAIGSARLMAVVKANAYGHGATLVAPAIADRVQWFGVDSLEEAQELAALELDRPILILGHTEPSEAKAVVRSGVRTIVFRHDVLFALSRAAETAGTRVRVHLKVETGLHRLGVGLSDVEGWATRLKALDSVELEGVYTHFIDVENPASSRYREQLDRLDEALTILKAKGFEPPIVHAAPTAGALRHGHAGRSLVRVGVGLYGIWPSQAVRDETPGKILRPVLSWKCRLAQVKDVPEGGTVGYDQTYRAPSPRRVGILPVGYYDGLDRKLSNRGTVLVRGRRAPIVGRIAMNMTMVDVTGTGAEAGEEVVLIGEQGSESITAEELATSCDTIAYEILARLNARLKRRF